MTDCVFCKIVRGEVPAEKVYEDDEVISFLDAFPFTKGQTLVIPKKHIAPWIFDVSDKDYTKIMLVSKKIAKAVDKAMNPEKTGLMIEGLELDHVHVKIFPLGKKGFGEYSERINISKEEMKKIGDKIKENLDNL